MQDFLALIEGKIQALLEGTLDRLLYPGAATSLSSRLVQIIDEKLQSQTDSGNKYVPDLITLSISPEKWDAWQEITPTLNQVASEVEAGWLEQGYQFRVPLRIQLAQNPRLTVDAIEISTSLTHPSVETSKTALQTTVPETPVEAVTPENAYFIINGKEQLYLTKAIIKIGRRSTSDIQIDDPLVSRDHLLLRAKQGYYLLFDLSSTGGTFINNQPVKTATLKPGDVVRIGKTLLIYNQNVPARGSNPTTVMAKEN
ncbi:MAG: DUF3662 domain-containing protein [Anaerolineaceae bacterium]|jgi:hypothetical protein|nr:DUF3662 domain-containing protein [Anaerolineaceae bacterium]MDI9531938.1 DUF3662 domain-containing protein [Chloroflexota bacterium]NLE92757.1 DUF3662 domain-containing protein [Chloroflexota bacterium]HNZ15638.1 DUF3662 domain-containing protein [Anaerolineaceae bacterium]